MTEPSAQTIFTQLSPSALKPCSHTSGQTRDGFCLIASSVSTLAVLTSSLVPALRLKADSERCEVAFQSPLASSLRQPTRRSSVCTDLVISAGAGAAGFSDAIFSDATGAAGAAATAVSARLRSASAA